MQSETRNCQNCKNPFTTEPDDFAFYEKMKVPAPTFCPECRNQRRMTWRNERTLYKRKCGAPGHAEEIISCFSPDKPFTVYDQSYWWSDAWDPLASGKEYDFSRPFFAQFRELLERTPLLALFNGNAVNTDYANHAVNNKGCYLISAGIYNENVMYSNRTARNKDSVDLYLTDRMEFCYDDANCGTSYRLFFSYGCEDCRDSYFLYDCRNCSDCFGCVGLRNKQYCVFNEQYTKEEYKKFLEDFRTGSYAAIEEARKRHADLIAKFPRKYMYSFKTVNSTGDILGECKNLTESFDILQAEDCKFVAWGGYGMKDTYDGYGTGLGELMYEIVDVGLQTSDIKFSIVVWGGRNVYYSYNCHNSSNIFGCVGLRSKQYCVLNKQYTKEEYEALVPKIIRHMNEMPYTDGRGRAYRYGEFFPTELSPFAYNETIAQEYFSLTEAEALGRGYAWRDPEEKNYRVTLPADKISDDIRDVGDDVLQQIIGCSHGGACLDQCSTAFRVLPQELAFYRRMNIPLPRLCFNCRHYRRVRQRNPLRLWLRRCFCAGAASANGVYRNRVAHSHGATACPVEFKTSYAPDRPEIVYCEACYNSEVV